MMLKLILLGLLVQSSLSDVRWWEQSIDKLDNFLCRLPPSLKSSTCLENKLHVILTFPTLEANLMHQAPLSPAHWKEIRTRKSTRATSMISLSETPQVKCWMSRSALNCSNQKMATLAQWRPSPRPSPLPPLTRGRPPTLLTSGAPRRTLSSTQPQMVWSMR